MVVVSHLFFFFDKKFGESVTRYESHPPSLELSISRQPLLIVKIITVESAAEGQNPKSVLHVLSDKLLLKERKPFPVHIP